LPHWHETLPGRQKTAARRPDHPRRRCAGAARPELDLGLGDSGAAGPLPGTSSRTGCLLDALDRGYRVLGLDEAAGGDGVFGQLVLGRIIEPANSGRNVGSAACAS
jgi:hypothetical protein